MTNKHDLEIVMAKSIKNIGGELYIDYWLIATSIVKLDHACSTA